MQKQCKLIINNGVFNEYTITTGLPIIRFMSMSKSSDDIARRKYLEVIARQILSGHRRDSFKNGVNLTHVVLEVTEMHKGKSKGTYHHVYDIETLEDLDIPENAEGLNWEPVFVMDIAGKGKRPALREDKRNFDVKPLIKENKGAYGGVCKTVSCNCTEGVIFQRARSLGLLKDAHYCFICATNITNDVTFRHDFKLLTASKVSNLVNVLTMAGYSKCRSSKYVNRDSEFNKYPVGIPVGESDV